MIHEPIPRVSAPPEPILRGPQMEAWPLGDLDVTPVTEHGWRVVDRTMPRRDPLRLLGFIERRGERYELLQFGAGFEWHEFASLDAALAYAITTAPRLVSKRRAAVAA